MKSATIGQFADNVYAILGSNSITARQICQTARRAYGKERKSPQDTYTARRSLAFFFQTLADSLKSSKGFVSGITPGELRHWLCCRKAAIPAFEARFQQTAPDGVDAIMETREYLEREIRSCWDVKEVDTSGPFIMPHGDKQ